MSDVQDLHRATTPYRMSNLFKRRKWRPTVDEEGHAFERKAEGWNKIRISWASKVTRPGTKDGGTTAPSIRRDNDMPSMTNDAHEEDAPVRECPHECEHSFVRGEDTSTPPTRNEPPNPSSNLSHGTGHEFPSRTATVDEQDLRPAGPSDAPWPSAMREPPRSSLKQGEQPPVLQSVPHPTLKAPLLVPRVDDLNTPLQMPLNGIVTAMFPGAHSIAIEAVYITVNQGNATNLVSENLRWSMRENDAQFEQDRLKGAVCGAATASFLFFLTTLYPD
ncbi:hypothetical protein FA13DRAFT_1744067 [Coprinellus micaceus]|uniref:Uncharacterized protein n=1 Tax=Coprinellus micaceus TaxID=71717 RepID=A0A4Y7SD63_COPMI|nr:hypothetical protein FA13DRAFT_1744067 [Coprinellus micaceus]